MRSTLMRLFGNLLFKWFLMLGKLFYNSIAIRSDVSAAHFAHSDWDMYHSMEEYMKDDDFITNKNKPTEKTND
jgi:hypothetical protein